MLKHQYLEKRIRNAVREEVTIAVTTNLKNHLEKAIEQGVINALKSFGADADNQQEVQKDFHFLRHLRKRSEESSYSLVKATISVAIGAVAVALWEGIKRILQK